MTEHKEIIKCPYCGESFYSEGYSIATAIYSPPVYKDGKLISTDPNIYTTHCHCLSCDKNFNIIRNSNGIKVVKD